MFPVASGKLCTPASTAPVECGFSASGDVTKGKRNRLFDDILERETSLRKKNLFVLKFKAICFKVQSNSALYPLKMLNIGKHARVNSGKHR